MHRHRIREVLRTTAIAARNLAIGANLEALLEIRQPRMLAIQASELRFYGRAIRGRRGLPERNVFETLGAPDVAPVVLGHLQRQTWFHGSASYLADLISICLICRLLEPKVIFEIGTLRGYTTLHLALNSPPASHIYTLDLPRGFAGGTALRTTLSDEVHIDRSLESQGYAFTDTDSEPKITCLYGDSATFDYSTFHRTVDFFFIDGAHSYDYVRSDSLNAVACCKPGSVIAWHDYGRVGVNGVTKWLRDFSRQYPTYVIPGGSLAYCVVP
jgi:predicted O-methyltransferase YrrM